MGVNKAIKQYMRELGSKGGKARKKNLTPEQRRKIAQKASRARWSKKKNG